MVPTDVDDPDVDSAMEKLGRVALITQGLLYLVVGLLALQVAFGDHDQASQNGALAAIARQPFGKVLLIVMIVGLFAYALWRLGLAVRGEDEEEEDDEEGGKSLAKRAANVGRAAVYASFIWFAIQIIIGSKSSNSGSGGGGDSKQKSTALILGWPGGRWIVVAIGLAVAGVAVWNIRKAIKRKFLEHLDLHERSNSQRKAIEVMGVVGYAARGAVWAVTSWFLIQAGLTHDSSKTKGLDGALRAVAETAYGTVLLTALAVGLFLFGSFRIIDGIHRRPEDITYS